MNANISSQLKRYIVVGFFLTSSTIPGICEPPATASEPTPAQLHDLKNSFSSDNLSKILSALKSKDGRIREEALMSLQNIPTDFETDDSDIFDYVAESTNDASDTVRIQALKTLTIKFKNHPKTKTILNELPLDRFPKDLASWARDIVFFDGAHLIKANDDLKSLTVDADKKMRSYLTDHSVVEAASLTEQWLKQIPNIKAVEITNNCLWFSTQSGLESGLLLDLYTASSSSTATPAKRINKK